MIGLSTDALYNALIQDAEVEPKDWAIQGRQVDVWKKKSEEFPLFSQPYRHRKIDNPNFVILIDYIPFDGTDGRGVFDTRHASRTLEVGVSYIFVPWLLS